MMLIIVNHRVTSYYSFLGLQNLKDSRSPLWNFLSPSRIPWNLKLWNSVMDSCNHTDIK